MTLSLFELLWTLVYLLFPTQIHKTFPRWSNCDNKSKGTSRILKSFKAIQSATNAIKTDWILNRVLISKYKTLFGSIWIFCNYANILCEDHWVSKYWRMGFRLRSIKTALVGFWWADVLGLCTKGQTWACYKFSSWSTVIFLCIKMSLFFSLRHVGNRNL